MFFIRRNELVQFIVINVGATVKTNDRGHQVLLLLNIYFLDRRLRDAISGLLGPILTLGIRILELFDLGGLDPILFLPLGAGKSQRNYTSTFGFVFFLSIIILISDNGRLIARRSLCGQNRRFILFSYRY